MSQLSEKNKRAIEYASVIIAITLMVLASDLLGEKEIIFPEIAALSVGCFLSPKLCWKTSYLRMIVCIEICAVLGVCIVCFVPFPLWLQIVLAFITGQLVFMFSGTTLAPMISAIVLPVMMQTRGFVYPLATLILTSYIAAKRFVLEKNSVKEQNVYLPVPLPEKADWRDFAFRTAVVTVLSLVCVSLGAKFSLPLPCLWHSRCCASPNAPQEKIKSGLLRLSLPAL